MKRIIITLGAALLVAVPAGLGFFDNASFAPSVAVRVPPHAIVLPAVDDHGGHGKSNPAGDDKGGRPATQTTRVSDDNSGPGKHSGKGKHNETGNDKGGHGEGRSGKGGGDDGSGHS